LILLLGGGRIEIGGNAAERTVCLMLVPLIGTCKLNRI
jgi:hypothetical protein